MAKVIDFPPDPEAARRRMLAEKDVAGTFRALRESLPASEHPQIHDFESRMLAVQSEARAARERGAGVEVVAPHQRQRLIEALVSQALVLSRRGPLLVLFEDVHWADPSTLELLGRLIESTTRAPICLAVTFRPEFSAPWSGLDHVTSLTLSRLGNSGRREMVAGFLGEGTVSTSVVEEVIRRTDGIPLFIEELSQSVAEVGDLDDRPEYRTDSDIPATLRDSLAARLDRLNDARYLAQVGSVIGRTFSANVLSAVSDISIPSIEGGIEKLLASQLVHAVATPDGVSYTFKHALVQEAAYLGMLRSERARLHGRIADALIESGTEQSEELARHLEAAGRTEEAAQEWLAAGLRSIGTFSNAEAVAHLSHAVELAGSVSASQKISQCRITALQKLTSAQMALHGLGSDEAKATLDRLEAEVRSGDGVEDLFAFLTSRSIYHTSNAEAEAALRISDEILDLSTRHLTPVSVAEAHYARCRDLYYLGRFSESLEAGSQALRVRNSLGKVDVDRVLSSVAPRHVMGETFRSRSSWALGMKDGAYEILDRLADSVSAADFHPDSLAWIYVSRSRLLQYEGMYDETKTAASALLELANKYGNEMRRNQALVLLGWAECAIGEFAVGLEQLDEGVMSSAKTAKTHVSEYYSLYAEAHLAAGNRTEAQLWAEKSMSRARELGDYHALPDLLRRYGEVIALATDDVDTGRKAIEEGLSRAELGGALSWSLGCAIALVRLGRKFDLPDLGWDALRRTYPLFTEGFDKPDLIEARSLLGQRAPN